MTPTITSVSPRYGLPGMLKLNSLLRALSICQTHQFTNAENQLRGIVIYQSKWCIHYQNIWLWIFVERSNKKWRFECTRGRALSNGSTFTFETYFWRPPGEWTLFCAFRSRQQLDCNFIIFSINTFFYLLCWLNKRGANVSSNPTELSAIPINEMTKWD